MGTIGYVLQIITPSPTFPPLGAISPLGALSPAPAAPVIILALAPLNISVHQLSSTTILYSICFRSIAMLDVW